MSKENTRTIKETTQLLYVSVSPERQKIIGASFERLLEYFAVMKSVSVDEEVSSKNEDAEDNAMHAAGVLRDGVAKSYENTQELIERSEEHEAQYIVIPNVL